MTISFWKQLKRLFYQNLFKKITYFYVKMRDNFELENFSLFSQDGRQACTPEKWTFMSIPFYWNPTSRAADGQKNDLRMHHTRDDFELEFFVFLASKYGKQACSPGKLTFMSIPYYQNPTRKAKQLMAKKKNKSVSYEKLL